jgi:asparagine synthase (glutamine-hydrolysing)
MCGIVGAFAPSGRGLTDSTQLEAMRDRMPHRGPDGVGLWRAPAEDCVLGHRRLSIIDLSTVANQPMLSADGKVAIVFNGEIYNHAEVRAELEKLGKYAFKTDHSDTEALLYAFIEWGPECVHKLYGMFAFAIYDARLTGRPTLHLVRDRIGIKPLYFTRTDSGEWLFASEIKALLAHPDVPAAMNDTAFWHYLTFIVSPAPMTLFDGIFKLPAGHWVTVDHQGRGRAQRYWDNIPRRAEYYTTKDFSFDEAVTELVRLLRVSIKRRMVSDVPFGVLLSGGVDSSLNVALMSELMDRPVTTFTVGYKSHGEFNEFEHARKLAERYRTDHHETAIDSDEALEFLPVLVELQDEPIADNVCIPLYFLSRLVKQSGTTVVQVGEGADENFLGYWWCEHYRQKAAEVYDPARAGAAQRPALKPFLRQFLNKAKGSPVRISTEDQEIIRRAETGKELFWGGAVCWWGILRSQLTPTLAPFKAPKPCPIDGLVPPGHIELDSHAVVSGYYRDAGSVWDEPEVLRKIPYMEHAIRLPEHLLMRVDKMTMAHSIEARVPFLDHDVVRFARRLPNEYKLADGLGKKILKKAAEPYVDHDLLYRRKQGFGAPIDKWFTDERFGKRCIDAFERSEIRKAGYLDNEFVMRLLKDQVSGRTNYGFHLWTVLNAVFWHERWIAGR